MTTSRIVYISTTDGEMDVWTMAPDGSDRRNLTSTPASEEDHPAWSPDGTIAFCSRRHSKGEIYFEMRGIVDLYSFCFTTDE
jgi:Tol biopolymer transport system component